MTAYQTDFETTSTLLIRCVDGSHHQFTDVKFSQFIDPLENNGHDLIIVDNKTNGFIGEYITDYYISDNTACFG